MLANLLEDIENSLYREKIKDSNEIITVFTPTYNRANCIGNLYDCLRNQTSKQFVWLVVCDGSTDDTDSIMKQLLAKNAIPIRYVKKENGGKQTALKLGMELAETPYFCDCDDDDNYSSDMLEFFLKEWNLIKLEGRNDICAIRALSQYENGNIVCNYDFNMHDIGMRFDMSTLEMNYLRNQRQENQTCYSTAALRSVKLFPQNYWLSEQHKYLAEGIWQGRLARKYKCRYIYKVVRYYNEGTEGITRGSISKQKALNSFLNRHMLINEQYDYFLKSKVFFIKHILLMGAYRKIAGISLKEQLKHIEKTGAKLFICLLEPLCLVVRYIKLR